MLGSISEADDAVRTARLSQRLLDGGAMPTDASILGFTNRWQAAAVPHAVERELASGTRIAAVSPPFLVATKLEAFAGRYSGLAADAASQDRAERIVVPRMAAAAAG